MPDHEALRATTTDGLPVAPSLGPALEAAHIPHQRTENQRRIVLISGIAILVAFGAGFIAIALTRLIGLITNVSFYGRLSTSFVSPAGHHLGFLVVLIPVIGGLIVGLMARFISPGIRGDGIPEAMEQVLYNQSRIAPELTIFKPLSAAVVIGTGGPFGAEGPIIATGGALGSLVGQLMKITADERKILLAAGAAAGMAATFGAPVAAVLLAIELLLFEYRARSLVPVALASATATAVRMAFYGSAPLFPMPDIAQPGGGALAAYILLGGVVGVCAVYVTKTVYLMEDAFDRLPIHWMWWPALGGLIVGLIGYVAPHTMGPGYDNIQHIIAGDFAGTALLFLVVMKFLSWTMALGSGTSGGTLAPLFTIGGGLGSVIGALIIAVAPGLGLDIRIAAVVGMAAIFAGASRALLSSVIFAFEVTHQPMGLLPLLGGCSAAYLASLLLMRHTINTEKLARRGSKVDVEYAVDFLSQVLVREIATPDVVAIKADDAVEDVRDWLASRDPESLHQGFPVLGDEDRLIGVVTRRNLLNLELDFDTLVRDLVTRPPVVIYDTNTAREAADHMVREQVGRLPVVTREQPTKVVGIVTRSDLLAAHARRLAEAQRYSRQIELGLPLRRSFHFRRRSVAVHLHDGVAHGTPTQESVSATEVLASSDGERKAR